MPNECLNAQMTKRVWRFPRAIWGFGFWAFFRHSDFVIFQPLAPLSAREKIAPGLISPKDVQ
jgi:hypothetical protein